MNETSKTRQDQKKKKRKKKERKEKNAYLYISDPINPEQNPYIINPKKPPPPPKRDLPSFPFFLSFFPSFPPFLLPPPSPPPRRQRKLLSLKIRNTLVRIHAYTSSPPPPSTPSLPPFLPFFSFTTPVETFSLSRSLWTKRISTRFLVQTACLHLPFARPVETYLFFFRKNVSGHPACTLHLTQNNHPHPSPAVS